MEALIQLGLFLFLLTFGYIFGTSIEKRHYRSIKEREGAIRKIPTTTFKKPIKQPGVLVKSELVMGSVVISVDYFKRFVAGLRNFFGGNVRAYETLIDRARREAILRMKESCPTATQLVNLRIETSSISKNDKKGTVGSVEVLAYATAVTYRK